MNSPYWMYVYYKTPWQDESVWNIASQDVVDQVTCLLNIQGKVLQRPVAVDGDITWMEVYGPLKGTMLEQLTNALELARSATALGTNWQDIKLYTELFVDQGASIKHHNAHV